MKKLTPLAETGRINSEASIRDSQSIIINAPIHKVWNILFDFKSWHSWNPDISVFEISDQEIGSVFKWTMNGIKVTSTIRKIQQPELISWTASAIGIKGIHVWKLEESDKQTIVTTEESLQGIGTLFFSHHKLHSALLHWLDRLKQRAEQ